MAESDNNAVYDSLSIADCVLRMESDIAQSLDSNINEHAAYARKICCANFYSEDVSKLLSALRGGDYEGVLTATISRKILGRKSPDDPGSITKVIKESASLFVECAENPEEELLRHFLALCVGIASLQLFVQNNWTGPPSTEKVKEFLSENFHVSNKDNDTSEEAKSALSPEGSTVYNLVTLPELLLIAKCILVESSKCTTQCKTADWWRLRCLWVQQQLLDERSPEIYNLIMPIINTIEKDEVLMNPERSSNLPLLFHLECSHIYAYYYESKLATESIARAFQLAGLDVDLTGALGKRTRFQEDDKAQLVLRITRKDDGDSQEEQPLSRPVVEGLPKDLHLDDDTVLNAIKFKDESAGDMPSLSSLEQALVLGLCMEHKRSKPKDPLLSEELMSYIVGILQQPQCWAVQTLALRIRCFLERDRTRTVERAMMQMQVLVDQISSSSCPVQERMKLFYAINLPPKWTLEGELAELLHSLGCMSAALEIYVRLQLWENVVACYRLLGKPEKAIHVIKEQLDIKESAGMWCLMGDVTREEKHYEKAWEVSGQRSTRAQSSLGLLYLHDEQYDKAIECLEISLEKNFLQYAAWFNLGYAAFQTDRYETAVKAYKRCILLDSDDAQSWNNLATAYIRLNQKSKAFRTLQNALKLNYENWKIWDNFLAVSIDLGEFKDAVKAYKRLLELREKHVDEAVLQIMVRAVTEDLADSKGNPVSILRPKMLDLFEEITAQVTNNANIWSLYWRLLGSCGSENAIENDKALQCLQRSHRLVIQDQRWHTEVCSVKEVITETQTLAEAYEKCSAGKPTTAQAIQLLSSAKLMMKSVISKIKQEHHDPVAPPPSWAELSESVAGLETKLQELVDRIAQLREA